MEWETVETIEAGLADRLSISRGRFSTCRLPTAMPTRCSALMSAASSRICRVRSAECAPVLKPGGVMISYVTVATDRMAAFEQAELDASQGTVAASMDRVALERASGEHFTMLRESPRPAGSSRRLPSLSSSGPNPERPLAAIAQRDLDAADIAADLDVERRARGLPGEHEA
jgi:hypothetical protein